VAPAGRRLLAALLAVTVAAACAGDDGRAIGGGPAPGGAEQPPAANGTAPGSAAGDGGDASSPPGTPTTTGGGTPPGPAPSATTAPGDLTATGPPGSFADALLQARAGARLVVEVLARPGAEPRDGTVDHLLAVVGRESAKEVAVTRGAVSGGGGPSWTPQEITAVADDAGGGPQRPDAVRMRIVFLEGGLEGNDTVLGVAVRGDVAAVFPDRVAEAGALLGAARLERAVAVHEAGHLMGLVDLFLRTGREDPEHPGHSPNQESVMYWAVESTLEGQLLSGGPPTDFDTADRADLARIRSGG
jgi:hypothetical protein